MGEPEDLRSRRKVLPASAHRRTGRNRRRGSLPRRPERLVHHRPDDRDRRRRHGGAIALLPGRTKSRALRVWRDSTTSSSRRRPGSRRRKGAPLRANAWTPASAGATKVGITFPRTVVGEGGYPIFPGQQCVSARGLFLLLPW